MILSREDRAWIEARALAAGFDLAAMADVPSPESQQAVETDRRYTEWIDHGRAGDMEFLKRADEHGNKLRGDLRRAWPWAQSVLVCALNYNANAPRSIEPAPSTSGWIARYAWSGHDGAGSDYHDELLPKLKAIERQLQERFAGCESRCYVDTGPIVERVYAERAGIGWVGKNTCMIHQQQGSWLLLGVIVTSLRLQPAALPVPAADRCGSCTRCIDACPTDALLGEHQMDASLCIAYLTIEKKGSIAPELREAMGRQVFGCDICQDVCPWNRRAPIGSSGALQARSELVNPALEWLAQMDGPTFNRWFRGSPLERTRRKRIRRNVAIAMGNSGEQTFLPTLRLLSCDDDAAVAESGQWAVAKLEKGADVH